MELDDNLALASSDSADTLDAAPVEQADASANSSDASGDKSSDDMASIVRDVVAENRSEETASPAEGQEAGQSSDAEAHNEPDDENYSDVPFSKHPRFRQLISQRNAFRQDAERYQNVQNFLDTNGLAAEEAADALVIAGLMKTNPVEAWNRLKPVMQNLLHAAGEVLPGDLEQMVASGQMTHEAALQVSRARASVQSVQAYQSFERQRFEREQATQRERALVGTAEQWEADRRAKDPNFEAKLVPIQKELAFIQMTEGKPQDPQGVLSQLKRAYDAVSGVGVQQPQMQPRRPVARPVIGGQVAGNAAPKPQNTLDIIRAARGAR